MDNLVISKQKERYKNYEEIMQIAKKKRTNIIIAEDGMKIACDKTSYFDILYPLSSLEFDDINNNSIVAKFICRNKSILFTRRYRG